MTRGEGNEPGHDEGENRTVEERVAEELQRIQHEVDRRAKEEPGGQPGPQAPDAPAIDSEQMRPRREPDRRPQQFDETRSIVDRYSDASAGGGVSQTGGGREGPAAPGEGRPPPPAGGEGERPPPRRRTGRQSVGSGTSRVLPISNTTSRSRPRTLVLGIEKGNADQTLVGD